MLDSKDVLRRGNIRLLYSLPFACLKISHHVSPQSLYSGPTTLETQSLGSLICFYFKGFPLAHPLFLSLPWPPDTTPDTTPPYSPTPLSSCKFSSPGFQYPEYCHISFLPLLWDHAVCTCLFRSTPCWLSLHLKVLSASHFAWNAGHSDPSSGTSSWHLFDTNMTFWGVGGFIPIKAHHRHHRNKGDNDNNKVISQYLNINYVLNAVLKALSYYLIYSHNKFMRQVLLQGRKLRLIGIEWTA